MRSVFTNQHDRYPDGYRFRTSNVHFLNASIQRFFLFFAFFTFFFMKVNGQSTPDLTSCYAGSNCTSGEFTISKIYLASDLAGTPLTTSSCSTPGATVQVYLAITFSNNTSSDRDGIFLSGTITSGASSRYIYYCFSGKLPKQVQTTFVAPDQFTWTCGDALTLTNGFTGWNSASGPVCQPDCSGTTISKCRSYPTQTILTPLVANFTSDASCNTGAQYQTISLTSTTSGGVTPYSYKWEYSTDNSTWTQFSTEANPDFSPGNTNSYYIKLTVTDAGTPQANVDDETKSGIAAGVCCTTPVISNKTATICSGSAFSISPVTGSGDVVPPDTKYTWTTPVSDPMGAVTGGSDQTTPVSAPISQTLTNTTNSAATLTYTVTPTSGSCTGDPFTITVTVDALPEAGAGGSHTTCVNSAYTLGSGEATAANGTIAWSENGAGSITAGGTTLTPTYTPAAGDAGKAVTLTLTVTSNNTCGTASATATYTINVDAASVGGTINSPTVCSGFNGGTLTLTGSIGTIVRWEFSTSPSFASKTNIANTSTTQTFTNLAQTTYYRALVQNGVCSQAYSTGGVVTVSPCGGHMYPTQTTCSSYLGGAPELPFVCATAGKLKGKPYVSNATPGVFFYYATITAPSSSFTVDILQKRPGSNFNFFSVNQDQVIAWNASCGKIASASGRAISTSDANATKVSIAISGVTAGSQIVISIKYDTKTLIGSQASNFDVNYYFGAYINNDLQNGSVGTLRVTTNCSTTQAVTSNTSARMAEPVKDISITAYPNPFTDKVRFVVASPVSGQGSLEVFNLLGQKVKTVYQGHIVAGKQSFELQLPVHQQINLIYRLQIGERTITGKLFHGRD